MIPKAPGRRTHIIGSAMILFASKGLLTPHVISASGGYQHRLMFTTFFKQAVFYGIGNSIGLSGTRCYSREASRTRGRADGDSGQTRGRRGEPIMRSAVEVMPRRTVILSSRRAARTTASIVTSETHPPAKKAGLVIRDCPTTSRAVGTDVTDSSRAGTPSPNANMAAAWTRQ